MVRTMSRNQQSNPLAAKYNSPVVSTRNIGDFGSVARGQPPAINYSGQSSASNHFSFNQNNAQNQLQGQQSVSKRLNFSHQKSQLRQTQNYNNHRSYSNHQNSRGQRNTVQTGLRQPRRTEAVVSGNTLNPKNLGRAQSMKRFTQSHHAPRQGQTNQTYQNPMFARNTGAVSQNLFPSSNYAKTDTRLNNNIFGSQFIAGHLKSSNYLKGAQSQKVILNNDVKKKQIQDREHSRTHKLDRSRSRQNISQNVSKISTISRGVSGKRKHFNHMTRNNLRKIENMMKSKGNFNNRFKYGKEEINNNTYNSLSYWKERKNAHSKRQKLMQKSKGLDKERQNEFFFGVGMRQSSTVRKSRMSRATGAVSPLLTRNHVEIQAPPAEASVQEILITAENQLSPEKIEVEQVNLDDSGNFDDTRMSEVTPQADSAQLQEFSSQSKKPVKGIEPNFSKMYSKQNLFFPKKSRPSTDSSKIHLDLSKLRGKNYLSNANPLFQTYGSPGDTSFTKQPVRSGIQHRKSKQVNEKPTFFQTQTNVPKKQPRVSKIKVHKRPEKQFERTMENMRREKNLDKVSNLDSPRTSTISDIPNAGRFNDLKYQPQAIIKNKFYERIQAQNYFQPNTSSHYRTRRVQQKSILKPAFATQDSSPIPKVIQEERNPLQFTYGEQLRIGLIDKPGQQVVGILKNGDSCMSEDSLPGGVDPSHSRSVKQKKGVQFDSKIHMETGVGKLKEEGQFRKPRRKK